MAIRPIIIHPDPRLKKVADPVDAVDDDLRRLADDMLETMYDAPGIGLAAPQIGVLRRLVVMDCAGRDDAPDLDLDAPPPPPAPPSPMVLVNPEIVWRSETVVTRQEGCLSIPDQFDDVARPDAVRVRYIDRDGREVEQAFESIEATCVQHEIDHLNGKLFIDYLGPVRRSMITQKMKKLKRERAHKRA